MRYFQSHVVIWDCNGCCYSHDWGVRLGAFGVGQALINSGVASAIASFLVKVGTAMGIGSAGLLGAVYLATVLTSQLVANNAAAALIFPIAMDAADRADIDHLLMAFAIMLAASPAFMTPFGYQTNLIKSFFFASQCVMIIPAVSF